MREEGGRAEEREGEEEGGRREGGGGKEERRKGEREGGQQGRSHLFNSNCRSPILVLIQERETYRPRRIHIRMKQRWFKFTYITLNSSYWQIYVEYRLTYI